MRPRRLSAHASPTQADRRQEWQDYTHDGRWRARRRAWLASPAANGHCHGCEQIVGECDDVHHLAYPAVPGTEGDGDLVLLRRACHEAVHTSIDASTQLRRMSRRSATWTVLNQLYRSHHPQGDTP